MGGGGVQKRGCEWWKVGVKRERRRWDTGGEGKDELREKGKEGVNEE